MMNQKMKPAIVMQTDFSKDISTCTMEGVCMKVDPELRTFDSTHNIPNFSTYTASSSLAFVVDYWPEGTVFVSVVDPGVGTSRRGCVAKLKNGSFVVTPDNGSPTHMLRHPGIESVREIDETVNRLPGSEGVNIFHGRDVFAYTAARLASGAIDFEGVGREYPVEEIVAEGRWKCAHRHDRCDRLSFWACIIEHPHGNDEGVQSRIRGYVPGDGAKPGAGRLSGTGSLCGQLRVCGGGRASSDEQ